MTTPANIPGHVSQTLQRDPQELPALFSSLATRRDVADMLEIQYMHLVHILYRAPHRYRYRTFYISKKSGGQRSISEPAHALKVLQSKLNHVLQLVYSARPSAHGFLPHRSIVTNALRHTGKRFVLNVDLADFFPSINFGRVLGLFNAPPYNLPPEVATTLAQICCHNNQLPQGAPTSPIISNMICHRLDRDLQKLAMRHRSTYTRYADDITFSTTRLTFPHHLAEIVTTLGTPQLHIGDELRSAIQSNGFKINDSKTRLQLRDGRQEVTGLTVNKFANVPRRFVRQLRAILHAVEKFGWDAAEDEFHRRYDRRSRRPGSPKPPLRWVLLGRLNFLKMVKGEDHLVYRRLRNRLSVLDPALVHPLPLVPPATSPATPMDTKWQYYVDNLSPSIYHLEVRKTDGRTDGGTAFAFSPKFLATAAHLLDGRVFICPPFPDGEEVSDAVAHHLAPKGADVALVPIPSALVPVGSGLPVRLEPLALGEPVLALGFAATPQRQPALSVSTGLVESRTRDYTGEVETVVVSIDIAGGMSGAPVIDSGGSLVGVVAEITYEKTADGVPARAFSHIVPATYLRELERTLQTQ